MTDFEDAPPGQAGFGGAASKGVDGGFSAWFREGYDRRSFRVLGALAVLYAVMGLSHLRLVDLSKGMDWLLAAIWVVMSALLVWRIDLRRDAVIALVGFVGGAVIEWWGTNTRLWVYFTLERPPLWILPAWPVAALTVHRLARIALRLAPWLPRAWPVYWLVMPAFIGLMTWFLWPSAHTTASQVVVLLMVGVGFCGARPRLDVVLFLVGAGLGVFLEYWGTTRFCWTYYTREQPPVEAVLAHGFAAVAFGRGTQVFAVLLPPEVPGRHANSGRSD